MKKLAATILVLCITIVFSQEKEVKVTDKKTGETVVLNSKNVSKNINQPLYVLIYKQEKLLLEQENEHYIEYINPKDIESINILKDEKATNNYGEKGNNGVLEIYLKENSNNNKYFYDLQAKLENNGKN